MRTNYGLGQLSAAEKSDILDQHRSLYNGYQTMQPQVSNTQPLYVYDPAGDKEGLVVNNKGEVKKYTNFGINEQVEKKSMCECGGEMYEGECMECGSTEMYEETGHLDDIYKEKDLNLSHGDFDYVEGGGNDYGTFEGMHKNLYKEDDIIDDDGFEDIELSTDELGEQGGNADDMNTDSVEPAYDFESGGPGDVYPVNEYDDEDGEVEYERMESAWADDEIKEQGWGTVARIAAPIVIDYAIDKLSNEGEIGEVDVSGSQGIYGDMDPAYDFDSDGPGSAGPYQTFSYNEDEDEKEDDYENEWEEIDTDLQEDFKTQKNKISEMFNRMSRYN